MSFITLGQARRQLQIDADEGDDETIQECIDDAIQVAADFLNREIPWEYDNTNSPPSPIVPGSVRRGILYLMAEFYQVRKAGNLAQMIAPDAAVTALLFPYRVGMGA
jgi:hypothetical protein